MKDVAVEKQPLVPGEISLLSIDVLDSFVSTTSEFKEQPRQLAKSELRLSASSLGLREGNSVVETLVGYLLTIEIIALDEEGNNIGLEAKFIHRYVYKVENILDYYERNNVTSIGSLSMSLIAETSYSTSRGIIYSHLLTTPFSKIILPVVDAITLVQVDSQ